MSCASNVSETKSFVTTTAQRRSKRRTTRSKMQARSDCGPRPTPSPISMISKWWPSEFREIFQKKPREVRSMSRFVSKSAVSFFAVVCFLLSGSTAPAQEIPSDYQEVLKSLDRKGDFKAGVLKVNIPRNDLKMTIQGFSTPTPFGFGGWIALTKATDGTDVMMGHLVLLQEEVNPGLDLIGHVTPAAPAPSAGGAGTALDTAKLAKIIGHEGEQSGAVYKITVGRDDLGMKEHGAVINARMGLNTWAAFVGTHEDAAIAGDVAMLESEVTPVLKALRKNGLDVVAIHHHMTGDRPVVIFLHYWGRGPAEKLATGFKAALDELGKGAPAHGGAH